MSFKGEMSPFIERVVEYDKQSRSGHPGSKRTTVRRDMTRYHSRRRWRRILARQLVRFDLGPREYEHAINSLMKELRKMGKSV